jgi:Uncharacterized protein conserved in bacteria
MTSAQKVERRIFAIPPNQAAITEGFWKERLAVNRRAIIPAEYKQCKETGRLDVWSWQPGDPHEPHIFWDSDVAKWIEAIAYAHYEEPDLVAEAQADAYIDAMAKAQAPDGYCNSHYIKTDPENRWTDLRNGHELYGAGHLIEAAVAYFQATGKDALLNIMLRYVDCIRAAFGTQPGQKRGIPGHPEIELALIRLHQLTGNPAHLELAAYFIDERGHMPHYWDIEEQEWKARGGYPLWLHPYEYSQSEMPARELGVVKGHAVRAMYFYASMADLAADSDDPALLAACRRLWDDLTRHKLYITAGIGSSRNNEGFTTAYDLPNETAYSETCAAIGLVFWAQRLLAVEPHRRYADLIERAIYNAILSGVSLDGTRFFYENPLASRGAHTRQAWFGCACCPPNIARFLAALPQYIANSASDGIWIHQYISSRVEADIAGARVAIEQRASYPWTPDIAIRIDVPAPIRFTLRLRIPEWTSGATLTLNGAPIPCEPDPATGYIAIDREWRANDTLALTLPLTLRYAYARPEVGDDAGRAAVMRGPIVYCVEQADNGADLAAVILPPPAQWREAESAGIFEGIPLLETAAALAPIPVPAEAPLYADAPPALAPKKLLAIPYFMWDNRGAGEMRVWLRHGL